MSSPITNDSNDLDHSHHEATNYSQEATNASADLRTYACPLPGCSGRFKRRFTLKEHIKTHTGEKSFKCPVPNCPKSFTTAGNLSRHKRSHPWLETTFECLIVGCNCTFVSETKLERHMYLVHFGLSTHLCPYADCGGAFSSAGNLKRHLRQQHAHSSNGSPVAGHQQRCAFSSPVAGASFAASNTMYHGLFFPQEEKQALHSPLAVDSFAYANPNYSGHVLYWATPPAMAPMLPSPALPPLLSDDGDMVDALGFLFELGPNPFM